MVGVGDRAFGGCRRARALKPGCAACRRGGHRATRRPVQSWPTSPRVRPRWPRTRGHRCSTTRATRPLSQPSSRPPASTGRLEGAPRRRLRSLAGRPAHREWHPRRRRSPDRAEQCRSRAAGAEGLHQASRRRMSRIDAADRTLWQHRRFSQGTETDRRGIRPSPKRRMGGEVV